MASPSNLTLTLPTTNLVAVIKQLGYPVAYYSRKLTPAQMNYTTIEKEGLGIVETLKEYRTLLLGNKIVVNCDHKIAW